MGKIKNTSQLQMIPGGSGVYNWLRRNNPNLLRLHLPNTNVTWTKDLLIKEALKYKTRTEWATKSSGSVRAAVRLGIYEECTKHMLRVYSVWTKDLIIKEALKYKTRGEWKKKNQNCYNAAGRLGIYEECTKHMGPPFRRAHKAT